MMFTLFLNLRFWYPDEFMKQQLNEYHIGKRHLANMMGKDPEIFTQEDVDVSDLII